MEDNVEKIFQKIKLRKKKNTKKIAIRRKALFKKAKFMYLYSTVRKSRKNLHSK